MLGELAVEEYVVMPAATGLFAQRAETYIALDIHDAVRRERHRYIYIDRVVEISSVDYVVGRLLDVYPGLPPFHVQVFIAQPLDGFVGRQDAADRILASRVAD